MTAKELRAALRAYSNGPVDPGNQMYAFGLWWWDKFLDERGRERYRNNSRDVWQDLVSIRSNEKLMFLWACYLM